MSTDMPLSDRSYGCSLACGNPYDFVVVMVSDGSTQFLCTPCFVRTATEMLEAMIDPKSDAVQRKIAEAGVVDVVPFNDDGVVKRGHNAPVDSQDPDAIEEFASYVLPDEIDYDAAV